MLMGEKESAAWRRMLAEEALRQLSIATSNGALLVMQSNDPQAAAPTPTASEAPAAASNVDGVVSTSHQPGPAATSTHDLSESAVTDVANAESTNATTQPEQKLAHTPKSLIPDQQAIISNPPQTSQALEVGSLEVPAENDTIMTDPAGAREDGNPTDIQGKDVASESNADHADQKAVEQTFAMLDKYEQSTIAPDRNKLIQELLYMLDFSPDVYEEDERYEKNVNWALKQYGCSIVQLTKVGDPSQTEAVTGGQRPKPDADDDGDLEMGNAALGDEETETPAKQTPSKRGRGRRGGTGGRGGKGGRGDKGGRGGKDGRGDKGGERKQQTITF